MAQTYDILPDVGTPTYDTWVLGAGASKVIAVQVADGDTSYVYKEDPATGRQSWKLGQRPQMFTLSTVQAVVQGKNIDNYSAAQELHVHARLGTTDGTAVTFTGLGDALGIYAEGLGTLLRPGGGTWSVSDIQDSTLEIVANITAWEFGVGSFRISYIAIRVGYTPVPTQTFASRLRASRYVFMYRKPPNFLDIVTTPDKGCDMELLDPFILTHKEWPTADGRGAGVAPWTRPLFIEVRSEVMPELDRVKITGYDARYFLTSFYEAGHTLKSASQFADGVMRIDHGNTRTFSRDSKAWVQDPGGGEVRELGDDLERYDSLGLLFENYSEQHDHRSSFKSYPTGVTGINTNGGGQGTTAMDTTDLLFETGVTPQSMKITAATPAQASDHGFSLVTDTILANTRCAFSVDYKNDSGGTLEVQLQRPLDSWYYNPSTPGWQAGVSTITLPASTSKVRYRLANIDVGGTNTTITQRFLQLNGLTVDGQIDHVYHVQLETTPWVTGRIFADGATVIRETESLKISNGAGKRAWFHDRGTAYFKFFPSFDAAVMDEHGGFPNFFTLEYDANNYFKVFYNGAAGSRVDFEAKVAGTAYEAHADYVPVAYDETGTWITVRWASSLGEWGLAPYTISVFVNGVKGTDVTLPALPSLALSVPDLYIGGNDVDWAANGAMRYIWLTPRVHSDDEVRRLTAA